MNKAEQVFEKLALSSKNIVKAMVNRVIKPAGKISGKGLGIELRPGIYMSDIPKLTERAQKFIGHKSQILPGTKAHRNAMKAIQDTKKMFPNPNMLTSEQKKGLNFVRNPELVKANRSLKRSIKTIKDLKQNLKNK